MNKLSMKIIIKAMLGMILVVFCVVFGMNIINKNSMDPIERLIHSYEPQGASILLIHNGSISEIRNYGYANKKEMIKVKETTQFKIASISKTLTAYGVMKLVKQGVLDLDAPVKKYMKRWQFPETEFDSSKATLRTLLSHTSGVSASNEQYNQEPLPDIAEAIAFKKTTLIREPGTQFEYSDFTGYGICQMIIEDVTGMSFEDYMIKKVFIPLGMNTTSYINEGTYGQMAIPYAGFGKPVEISPMVMVASGGVTSSCYDLGLFLVQMIKEQSELSDMFSVQENTNTHGDGYCLGLVPYILNDGRIVYQHNGTLLGWNAQIAFEPNKKEGIVILTNSDLGFYLTYDVIETWSQNMLGEKVVDEAMLGMKNMVGIITAIIWLLFSLLTFIFIIQVKRRRIIALKKGERRIITFTSVTISIVCYSVLLAVMYTKSPMQILYGMENYYAFTFFPPTIHFVTAGVGVLLLCINVRLRYKRRM